jgi:hypothetical protein
MSGPPRRFLRPNSQDFHYLVKNERGDLQWISEDVANVLKQVDMLIDNQAESDRVAELFVDDRPVKSSLLDAVNDVIFRGIEDSATNAALDFLLAKYESNVYVLGKIKPMLYIQCLRLGKDRISLDIVNAVEKQLEEELSD